MISYFLNQANLGFNLNNGFLTGFMGPSILKVPKHIKRKPPNLQLFHFSTIEANPGPLNTGVSMSTGRKSFFPPQHLTPEWGTLDNSVYVFPVSTI